MIGFRQLGLALLVPFVLGASASSYSLQLNGQPLPGSPLSDAWVPVWRLWSLGVSLRIEPKANRVPIEDGTFIPVRWQGVSATIPIDQLPRLGIEVETLPEGYSLHKVMAEPQQWRVESEGDVCRFVWETDRPVTWRIKEAGRHVIVELGGAGGAWPATTAGSSVIKQITLTSTQPGMLVMDIERRYPTPLRLNSDGRHFSLELERFYARETTTDLPQGMQYTCHQSASETGPLVWHKLFLPSASAYKLTTLIAQKQGGRFARFPVSRLASDAGAVVAVNAGYFSMKEDYPIGLLMQGGKVLTSPIYNRTFLALPQQGKPFISQTQLSVDVLAASGQSAEVDWFNFPRQRNSLAVYTERFGLQTGTVMDGACWEVAVDADGRVEAEADHNLPIPLNGFVIAAQGPSVTWLRSQFPVGALAALRPKVDQIWPGLNEAIAGGPTLVRGGQVALTAVEEKFAADITQGRAPRTAIGIGAGGDLTLLVVDGRDTGHSMGMTLTELAAQFMAFGTPEAMNLDGGGSSTMVINGRVVNRPSDGHERLVSTGLGILIPKGAVAAGRQAQ
ncbi:MAG: phosphodiester glycosidase family protein [Candidatus Sericytochromatia bacterium]|nr:phosphodiester glycosidase family protein [Candidatus Sericytochromatia bacterium]